MPRRKPASDKDPRRVQCGVRMEPRLLKVLKALAEYLDLSLSELLELLALQAFEPGEGFSRGTLRRVDELKRIYDMDYGLEELRARLFTDRR